MWKNNNNTNNIGATVETLPQTELCHEMLLAFWRRHWTPYYGHFCHCETDFQQFLKMMASNLTSQLLFWFRSTYYHFVLNICNFLIGFSFCISFWAYLNECSLNFMRLKWVFVRIKLKLSQVGNCCLVCSVSLPSWSLTKSVERKKISKLTFVLWG